VRLGFEEFSWWFFGVGLLFWIVLMSVVMDRLLFVQPPLPDRLLPTLCILLAPPTVGFLSWVQLTKQHPDGQGMDGVGQLLFGLGVFFALFLLSQVRRFIRLPFFMSWWAFSFPTAAFTTSVLVYGQFMPAPWVTPLGGLMVLITTVLILFLLVRTALAIARRETQWVD
jgi:tellurite resistance protein